MTTGKDHDVKLYNEFMNYVTKLLALNAATEFALVFMISDNKFESFTHFEFPADENDLKNKKSNLKPVMYASLEKGWMLWKYGDKTTGQGAYKDLLTKVEYNEVKKDMCLT